MKFTLFYGVFGCFFDFSKLFLFERKSYKKKQKTCRFIACAESFGIPFDVLFSRLSHGVSKQKDHIMVFCAAIRQKATSIRSISLICA